MKAFGWAADSSGCYYYRIAEPLDALAREEGWEVDHNTIFKGFPKDRMTKDDPRLPKLAYETAQRLDVIITQRTVNPAPSMFLRMMNDFGAFTVYEIDDDLFNIDPSNVNAHETFTKPEIRANLENNMRAASRVTVSTEPLAELLKQYHDDIRVCPNSAPDWLLEHEVPRLDNGKVTIGWGGSATHAMDFAECDNGLRRFLNQRDDVEFHCIGSNYARWMKLPKDKCRFTPWVNSVPDFFKAIDYDIGIAPLRPHVFNRSKSNIKALECAALGIPMIASHYHPYRDFIEHGVTGFLVRYPHEWGRYLRMLVEDPAMRSEMGSNARKLAAGHTMSAVVETWREALTP